MTKQNKPEQSKTHLPTLYELQLEGHGIMAAASPSEAFTKWAKETCPAVLLSVGGDLLAAAWNGAVAEANLRQHGHLFMKPAMFAPELPALREALRLMTDAKP